MLKRIPLLVLLLVAGCAAPPVAPPPAPPTTAVPVPPLSESRWEALPGWQDADLQTSWKAFREGCRALKNKPAWQDVCAHGEQLTEPDNATLRGFFEQDFTPYQVSNPDGTMQGLVTGYYEPRLSGNRVRTERFRYPLYAVPDDMLTIDMGELYPQLKGLRLRGRVEGKRVVPYYNRAEIDEGRAPLQGRELFWVDDAVELFFLQVQGSGRIELPDGTLVKVGYADQNGHPYNSIGRKLVETGELKLEEASMQGIKRWAEQNPQKLPALLAQNPSYVFFRELPNGLSAPLGALGVPLTEAYSIAIDPRTVPLGAPVFLATTRPDNGEPLQRLMLAQDTGGAIKGAVRADFFWGYGDEAGAMAGKMKQKGEMWVLLPKGMALPEPPPRVVQPASALPTCVPAKSGQ
ncbi:MAG TPA: MltA domain-containing protein [Gallionella sp.]|nr:MltA domain-containing protein [Gallionella sp.]